VNLRWNSELFRFEAGFTDFQSDLALVKKAGFRYDGPARVWWSAKAAPLTKIKGTTGLTITPEAREQYTRIAAIEEKNNAIKKQAQKERAEIKHEGELHELVFPEGKDYIDKEDLPPVERPAWSYTPPPPPKERCIVCAQPVYPYEYAEGGVLACLWCQKKVLDTGAEV
jgi:hypothetical protein